MFQNILKSWKTIYSFNDFKLRKTMALSCSKKIIASNHHGDFYCLNCLHCFATET